MKKAILFLVIFLALSLPVSAMEYTAPLVPDDASDWMPESTESFSDGLWWILQKVLKSAVPEFAASCETGVRVFCAVLLISITSELEKSTHKVISSLGAVMVAVMLLKPARSLIYLGEETIIQISQYGKLLLPVMAGAMAAQGGVTTSAALYTGTAFFSGVLLSLISQVLMPVCHVYMALSCACCVLEENMLKKLRDMAKWLINWSMRIVLYVFLGYMTITGAVNGTADAAALRAAKLTISSVVPVFGGILSDASQTILVSAGLMKSAAGIYGMLAMIAIWIGPFVKTGALYLVLKLTAVCCSVLKVKKVSELISDYSGVMGMVMGMIGTGCVLFLVSTVCFLKGVG